MRDDDLAMIRNITKDKNSSSLEVTVEITQFCGENCDYCSTNATTGGGKYLSVDDFIDIIKEIEKSGREIGRINISGGEPLSHPSFFGIKETCDEIVGRKNVYIYTNAIHSWALYRNRCLYCLPE